MRPPKYMNLSSRATRRWSVGLTLLALLALAMVLYTPIFGDFPRALITDPIDESKLVTLAGNTRPEARPKNDRGRVPDDYAMPHMFLQLKRSPQAEAELRQFMEQQTDKSSPNYHHWLTEQELGDKYGPTKQDLQIVKSWLESHNFRVDYIYPHGMLMDFSGTAGAVREAFHTEIHYLEVKGKARAANISDPKIPAALANAVAGPVSLHNFHGHPMLKRGKHRAKYTDPYDSGEYLLVPADVETIYNINPLYRQGIYGQGQTIAVVEDSDTYGTDVATFQSTMGLVKYGGSMVTLHPEPNGLTNCADPGTPTTGASAGDEAEANFDAQYSMAAAPGAVIQVVACPSVGTAGASFGGLIAINNMLAGNTAPNIISMSYGECEVANGTTGNLAYYTTFQTAAAGGISVFGSAGDEEAASCDADGTDATHGIGVSGWTDTPYNVAVGGTDYYDGFQSDQFAVPETNYWATSNTPTQGSALSYIPEIPWNDSCASYLLSYDFGYATTYGSTGFCNSATAKNNDAYLAVSGGSGGPSGCATGAASTSDVVSGTCQGYAKPTWQQGVPGNPADGVRDIPDVSLFAAIGTWGHFYIACWSDTTNFPADTYGTAPCTLPIDVFGTEGAATWSGYGGTSFSSPLMAGIQALVNQKWGKQGNPNSTYYSIATAQFNSANAANCQTQNAPVGRRGLGSTCIFNDVTQGDIDTNCRAGSVAGNCYLDGSTNGAGIMGGISTITITNAGSNYTSTPTCTLGAAAAQQPYVSPFSVTLYSGAVTPATCTASFGSSTATGSFVISGSPVSSWAGSTVSINSTTYTFVQGAPTAVNQVELHTTSSSSTNKTDVAKNLEAVVNATSSQCSDTGCVFSSQTANPAVTATESSSTVTLTAKTVGSGGNFTLASSVTADVTFSGGSNAASGVITALTASAIGSGYFGTTPCSITGGGGSGATCTASVGTTAGSTYQPAYGTNPGWDMATGLGSVNAYNLVMNTAW